MVLTWSALGRFSIQLPNNLPGREALLMVLRERSLNVQDEGEDSFSFRLVLNGSNEYEIHDGFHWCLIDPIKATDTDDAISGIVDILEHLARFKLVQDLENDNSEASFRESFNAQIVDPSGTFFSPGCLVEAEHLEKVELLVVNRGDSYLYVHVYDMNPCYWRIKNLLRATYDVIPPRNINRGFSGRLRKRITMTVPPEMLEKGLRQCEDTIKVLVTSEPTSFDLFELPKLGDLALSGRGKCKLRMMCRNDTSCILEMWEALSFPIRTSRK